jgi:hypothetical protein
LSQRKRSAVLGWTHPCNDVPEAAYEKVIGNASLILLSAFFHTSQKAMP